MKPIVVFSVLFGLMIFIQVSLQKSQVDDAGSSEYHYTRPAFNKTAIYGREQLDCGQSVSTSLPDADTQSLSSPMQPFLSGKYTSNVFIIL
jgi:hypothetical protein